MERIIVELDYLCSVLKGLTLGDEPLFIETLNGISKHK